MLALPSVFKKSAVVFYMTLERRIQNSIEHRKWNVIFTKHFILDVKLDFEWNVIFTKHFILDVKLDSEYVSTLKLQFQNEIYYHLAYQYRKISINGVVKKENRKSSRASASFCFCITLCQHTSYPCFISMGTLIW